MILALDAGNTQISLGCLEGREICRVARTETNRNKTEYDYAVTIEQILRLDGLDRGNFEGAVLASVVPPLTETLREAVRLLTGHRALVVGAGVKTGLNIGLEDPGTIGSDLVAAAVAALADHTPPIIIIDMGTATTMTALDAAGRLLGGAILPGTGVSLETLSATAALLPRINVQPPRRCIGRNTADCMRSGAVYGTASLLDGMIDRMKAELGGEAQVVATGSLASLIVPFCRSKITCDGDLILRGLGLIWEKNRKTK